METATVKEEAQAAARVTVAIMEKEKEEEGMVLVTNQMMNMATHIICTFACFLGGRRTPYIYFTKRYLWPVLIGIVMCMIGCLIGCVLRGKWDNRPLRYAERVPNEGDGEITLQRI